MYHTNEVTYVLILSQQNGKQPDDAQLLEQTVDQSSFADMFLSQVVHLRVASLFLHLTFSSVILLPLRRYYLDFIIPIPSPLYDLIK